VLPLLKLTFILPGLPSHVAFRRGVWGGNGWNGALVLGPRIRFVCFPRAATKKNTIICWHGIALSGKAQSRKTADGKCRRRMISAPVSARCFDFRIVFSQTFHAQIFLVIVFFVLAAVLSAQTTDSGRPAAAVAAEFTGSVKIAAA
jgi:hypothetical protein